MSKQSSFIAVIVFIFLGGCHSKPETDLRKYPRSKVTECIGLGSFRSDTLERCKLSMWANVPILLKQNRKLILQIPRNGLKRTLPCSENNVWIGHLDSVTIAKCVDQRVRLYWTTGWEKTGFGVSCNFFDDHGKIIPCQVSNHYDPIWPNLPSRELDFSISLEQHYERAEAMLK